MKAMDTRVSIAGVFRCCVAALMEYLNTDDGQRTVYVGESLPCPYCDDTMILCDDGTWRGTAAMTLYGPPT